MPPIRRRRWRRCGSSSTAAATLSNPYFGTVLASGKVRILGRPEDAIAKRFMITAWFASESTIEKNRDALTKFVRIIGQSAT